MPPNTTTTSVIEKEILNGQIKGPEVPKKTKNQLFDDYTFFGVRFQQKLIYRNIILIGLFHIGYVIFAVTYPYLYYWKATIFCLAYGISAGVGVTGGVHRYFTHRTYKATRPFQVLLLVMYAAAGHNKLHEWVRDHRVHHKYSETDADPHNSNRGFFFAHVGWLLMKKHPEVIEKGKTMDMSDITGDPLLVWYDKYFEVFRIIFCFALPICAVHYLTGLPWYWSIMSQAFGRYVTLLNITWLINSAAHIYGSRPYDKTIEPRENTVVSIIGLGEGWHNYHHAFPWDYKASEFGKINLTTSFLDLAGKFGWTYDFKFASDELIKKVSMKLGDGSHGKYGVYVDENGEVRNLKDD